LVERLEHKESVEFWVQVKSGTSFYRRLSIKPSTFAYWLRFIEHHPLILFHYPHPGNEVVLPASVLPLYSWIVANLPDLRHRLQHNYRIRIPIKAFHPVTNEPQVREILDDEQRRVSNKRWSTLHARKNTYFDEYDYFLAFPKVARLWERFELGLNQHVPGSLCEVLNVMDRYPIDRAPSERLEKAQFALYSALQGYPENREWRLASRFDAWTVAAARAMASKYPGFWSKAIEILKTWRMRPITGVLVALQMVGVAGNIDQRVANQAADLLSHVTSELSLRVHTLAEFRLAHHVMIAQSELFENHRAAKKAVALARQYPNLEIRHLRSYGWGFGPHVVTYYDRAFRRDTVRSDNSKDYSRGMRDLMAQLLHT
jgi:hypothetical protein